MRSLRDIGPMPSYGRGKLGEELWKSGVNLGATVKTFDDVADVKPYAALLEEAHLWIHRDYEHDAWHVLDVMMAPEVGEDFVMVCRLPGTPLHHFYPETTDDVASAPEPQLKRLNEIVDLLVAAAETPVDRFLARIIRDRVHTRNHHVIYDEREKQFYIEDLDPSREELDEWRSLL